MADDQYGTIWHEGKMRLWCGWCGTRRLPNDNGKCSVFGGRLSKSPYRRGETVLSQVA